MTILYTKLAAIYHEMYQSIFDYDEAFRTCRAVLRRHKAKKILEIGCGAGNLAARFANAGYDYTGMDLAKPMLRIARRENPEAHFLHGDMRRFSRPEKFDAVLVRGRSFAYLVSNEDVLQSLRCMRRALRPDGVLIFDNFDAEVIFRDLARPLRDRVRTRGKTITRLSKRSMNLKTGWTWNWDATYIVKEGFSRRVVKDHSVLRAFTRDELRLFLVLAGFTSIRLRRRDSVIFAVAQAPSPMAS